MEKELKQKSFCKWEKNDILKNIEKIYELTADPNFVCEKCARVANSEDNLCKPHKFKTAG